MYFGLFIILSHFMKWVELFCTIIELTYKVSYFYLMTKSKPGSKKGVSLSENEAMENTQRKCPFTFNQVSHPAARSA